jgi:hypothetical protein
MKKRYIVLFLTQTALIIICLIFAFMQKLAAEKATGRALKAQVEAERQRLLAVENERRAADATAQCQREIALCSAQKK